jgi:hypothetical protein
VSTGGARTGCWVAERLPGAGPCDGRLVRAHLIPAQRVRREVISARLAAGAHSGWPSTVAERAELAKIVWDERVFVPICGGAMGQGGHHGMLDGRQLKVVRSMLPAAVEDFAREFGLVWSLDRDYGVAGARGETPVGAVPLDPVGHMQARQLRRERGAGR